MKTDEPLAKRVWKSKAFVIIFAIFALLGIYGAITSLLEHYNLFKLVLEFIVSLIIALILGLIAYGIASLISKGKKRG